MSFDGVLGKDCKIYYKTVLLTGAPDANGWTLLDIVKDVRLGLDKDEADVTIRANDGWKSTVGTLKDASIEFDIRWDTDDNGYRALRAAFMDDIEVAFAVMDGLMAGSASQGLASNMNVFKFERGEPLAGEATASITIKPSSQTSWFVTST